MGTNNSTTPTGPVLLYDGTCGLCNRSVRFLLRMDKHGRLHFAALQSEPGQEYLRLQGLPTGDFDSLVYAPDWSQPVKGDYLLRTSGVVAALKVCGGFAKAMGSVLGVIPTSWRDAGYKLIARWRYQIWGEWKACPMPKPEWTKRFFG
jgi:predicted DCC family thiol-disulfide oxidoreductase YuxK